jgi:hypothetical protein
MYFHVLQCMFRTFSMIFCFNFHKRFQIFVNIYIHIYTFSYIPCLGSTAGVMGPGMAWPSGPSQGLSPCKVALTWCTLLKSIWRCLHQQSNWQLIVKTISEVGWWVQPWKCFGSFILESAKDQVHYGTLWNIMQRATLCNAFIMEHYALCQKHCAFVARCIMFHNVP